MAKKAAEPEIEGYSKDQGGPGWKRCPQCEGFVKGPLTKECPACHHKFVFKSKMVAKPIPGAPSRETELEQSVMLLALKMGGLGKVSQAIEKLRTDPLVSFTIKCGGVENTLRIIQAIETKLVDVQVGG